MEKSYQSLNKVHKMTRRILEIVSAAGVITGTVLVVVFTIMRYFFGMGFGWSEEFIRIIMLLGCFWMCGVVTADGGMVNLSILYDKVTDPIKKRILNLIAMITCLWIGISMFRWGMIVYIGAKGQMSMSTYFPKRFQFFSIPTGMALLVAAMVVKIILICMEIKWLKEGKTEEEIAEIGKGDK